MSKHTPGPWTVQRSTSKHDGAYDYAINAEGALVIAEAFGRDAAGGWLNAEANARLIAAAPDLLASLDPDTLDAIADEIDCFEHSARASGLRGVAKRQRAAISKAEGQS